MTQPARNTARVKAPAGIIFAVVGVLLFVYFVQRVGVATTLDYIENLGAGFLLVLLISAARPLLRALAWTRCFDEEKLGFRDALSAYLIGDACGNLVPLGLVLTEPIKVALVRERVSTSAGFAALAIENLFYSLSVTLFIFAGATALLLSFPVPRGLRYASLAALVIIALLLVVAYFVARKRWRLASGWLDVASRVGIGRAGHERRRTAVRAIEDRIYSFYAQHRTALAPILLLEACYHLAGVLEVYVTLLFITDTQSGLPSPTLLAAFVLESTNRVINVVFKFIPLRVGIDEAGSGLLARVLGLTIAAGVALAIIRKARVLVWTGIGVALLFRRGLNLRRAADAGVAARSEAETSRIN